MKNLFGFDRTEEYVGKSFIIRKTDCKITEYQEKLIVGTIKTEKRKKFPLWLTAAGYFCAFAVILIAFTTVMELEEHTFVKMLAAEPWKYIIAAIAAVCCLAIFIAERIFTKNAEKSPAFKDFYKVVEEEVFDKNYEKLKIPADADVIDALSCNTEADKVKKRFNRPLYFNVELRVFTENGALCLSDLEFVMAIPFEEITGVVKLCKTVKAGNWTKKQEYNAERFKQYGIRRSGSGIYFIKSFYSVRISRAGEEFELLVPYYDGEILKKYINF